MELFVRQFLKKQITITHGKIPLLWKIIKQNYGNFPGGPVVKDLPANAGDTGLIPDLEGSHMPRDN